MAIKLGGDTNITLTNTSFDISGATQDVVVPLFTATSDGTYYFEGDLQDGRSMSTLIRVNNTAKDIWTYWDGVVHHVNCEFTLVTGDVVQILTAGTGQGRNFTVVRYADEIKEIYVGEGNLVNDYSAMRGPCPEGFHVPLITEWQAVRDIWIALGGGSSDGTNFGIALKLPFAGRRSSTSAGVSNQGTYGRYWSSSRYDADYAYYLYFNSTGLYPQSSSYRAYGFSVRCFKDTPTIPTSSWTKLYGTSIEAGGIFWSSADGLISLSSDGQTWVTIADKNLGATTVWNSGDTLSEANCGKYYQRGNNYGFPRTGTIANQSTTQVDASNYGPGNYYSSDTFIKYSGRWDSTDNGNLWGGVTGVQQKQAGNVKEVYVGTTKVRPLKTYQQILDMATAEGNPRTNTIAELNSMKESYHTSLSEHLTTRTGSNSQQYDTIDGISYSQSGVGTWRIGYREGTRYRSLFNN